MKKNAKIDIRVTEGVKKSAEMLASNYNMTVTELVEKLLKNEVMKAIKQGKL